jgi:hypothetical protein
MRTATNTQLTEIFGQNRLINDLLRSGVEVATPVRDRGRGSDRIRRPRRTDGCFAAVPLQIKAATQRRDRLEVREVSRPSGAVRLNTRNRRSRPR